MSEPLENIVDVRRAAAQLLESWRTAGVADVMGISSTDAERILAELRTVASNPAAISSVIPTAIPAVAKPLLSGMDVSAKPTVSAGSTPPVVRTPSVGPNSTSVPEPMPRKAAAAVQSALPTGDATGLPSLISSPAIPAGQRAAALAVIQNEVAGCRRCTELASTRTQTVFGVGDPQARLCFVGEAPGADEDARGEPFVGRAGQLLTKIIEACKLTREEVYIANVLKCRPPNNRPPEPAEVVNCRGYLDRQLEIIRPETIVCLGATAAKCLLQTEVSIGKLRGRWHDYRGIAVYCTYHPAYLLRNPNAKRDVWEDMKVVLKRLGVEL